MQHVEIMDNRWIAANMYRIVRGLSPLKLFDMHCLDRVILSGEPGSDDFVIVAVFTGATFQFVVWDTVHAVSDNRMMVRKVFNSGMPILESDLPEHYRNSLDRVYQEWLLISNG